MSSGAIHWYIHAMGATDVDRFSDSLRRERLELAHPETGMALAFDEFGDSYPVAADTLRASLSRPVGGSHAALLEFQLWWRRDPALGVRVSGRKVDGALDCLTVDFDALDDPERARLAFALLRAALSLPRVSESVLVSLRSEAEPEELDEELKAHGSRWRRAWDMSLVRQSKGDASEFALFVSPKLQDLLDSLPAGEG
jgi:hypothetical protein